MKTHRNLWLAWVFANLLGRIIFLIPVDAIPRAEELGRSLGSAWLLGFALPGIAEGLLIGCVQAFALHPHLPHLRAWHWILLTILGAGGAWITGLFTGIFAYLCAGILLFGLAFLAGGTHSPIAQFIGLIIFKGVFAVAGAVAGATVARAQWQLLRRYTRNLRLWITANMLAGAVDILVGGNPVMSLPGAVDWNPAPGVLRQVAMPQFSAGILYGAISGFVLVRLLQQADQANTEGKPA